MKNTFGKVNLNKIILYLLIVVFLVLALQYAMAFFDLREGKRNKRRQRRLINEIQNLRTSLETEKGINKNLQVENEKNEKKLKETTGVGSESETFAPYY